MIDTSKDMRWMMNNFLEAGVASFSVTSEDPDHPKENMLDVTERTRTFKFAGRFLIEAGVNDKIYVGGVTYTIPAANYNSFQDLLTVIDSTVTGDAFFNYLVDSRKVSITSVAGITLNLSNQTNAIWQTIGITSTVDAVVPGSGTYNGNESRLHWPYEEIAVNFGYQAPIGFVAMISDLANEMTIPEGAVIQILGNTVNSFLAPPLMQTIGWYERGCFKFIDDIADSAWQYVRIRITCVTGNFMPEIGYLYIGDYQRMGERNISTGFSVDMEDSSDISGSDTGAIFGNSRTPYRVFSDLQTGLIKPPQLQFLKGAYRRKQKLIPFFIALDPKMYLSSEFDEYLAFVRFTQPIRQAHVLRDLYNASFEFREVV